MNVSSLTSSCESQVFSIRDEDMIAAGQESETSTSSANRLTLIVLNIMLCICYTEDTFLKGCNYVVCLVFAILRCHFGFRKIYVIALLKAALSCFCCIFLRLVFSDGNNGV